MTNREPPSFSELLFDEKRYRLLHCLLDNENREFSVNKLAKESDLSRQFVSEFTEDLSKIGLIKKEKRGNMYQISVETNSAFYSPLKKILNIDTVALRQVAENFAKDIYDSYEGIESIVLYGSVARGVPVLDSDIDVLVIKTFEEDESVKDLHQKINSEAEGYNKEFNVDISPHYYEKEKFQNDLKARRAFVENIVEEGEILAGEKFWQQKS